MAIYRGPGGSGDATNDATSQSIIATQAAIEAAESAVQAASSATIASNSASNALASENAAETAEANAENAQAAAEAAQAAAEAARDATIDFGDSLSVQATTLDAGSDATVVYDSNDLIIEFGIPRGERGIVVSDTPPSDTNVLWGDTSDPEQSLNLDSSHVDFTQSGSGAVLRSAKSKMRETVSVKDFGAVGNGVVDDTLAIQTAIDAAYTAGGGTVIIPNGTYKINGSIAMKSNVTVNCNVGATLNFNGSSQSSVINFTGSAGSEYAFTVAANTGDNTVTLAGSPSFNVGDLVHFVSVKNALSRADAGQWWLGDGTISIPYGYFAEWNYIAEDLGSGQYRLAKSFIFSGYNVNASGETETGRTTSAAQLVTPCQNSHWIGGTIIRNQSGAGANVFVGTWAVNCTVQNCIVYRGDIQGTTLTWNACFQCEGRNIENHNDPSLAWNYSTMHANYNRFKTVGSQDCGFVGLNESYGGQSVDFTYGSSGFLFCNVRSYVKDSSFSHLFEEITSHPGCFQELFQNNTLSDCYMDGITVRGYQPMVIGNVITSTSQSKNSNEGQGIGITLAYGATKRAFVSGNVIRGFLYGTQIVGSATLEWYWDDCLVNICNNEISECYIGLYSTLVSPNNSYRFIVYNNNNHSLMGRYVVLLGEYNAGVTITNNTLNGGFRYTGSGGWVAFVFAENNCPALTVRNNVWLRTKGSNATYTKYFVYVTSITDTTTYPKADWAAQTIIDGNYANYSNDSNFVYSSIGAANYIQSISRLDFYGSTISSGVAQVVPSLSRIYRVVVDTEGSASTDDLDVINPYDNCFLQVGDILYLKTATSARSVVLRDVSTSGASTNGIQTPGNASITINSSATVVCLMHTGTHWSVVSKEIS